MSTPRPLLSVGFARAYLVTGRPYLCFVSGLTGLAGLAGARALPASAMCALAAVFFAAYAFGQALTDVTQLDTDRLSAPYRPLVRGEIRPRDVLCVSLAGLLACAVVVLVFDRRAAVAALVPVAGLASYTPLKRRFWAGPIHNAWIVATLPILAALADRRDIAELAGDADLRSVVALSFFGYSTFVLLGYLKDVEADRATGYETVAVRFGRRATVATSFVAALASIAAAFALLGRYHVPFALVVGAAGAVALLFAHGGAWWSTRDADAHGPIVMGLRGYVALQSSVIIARRPELAPVVLVLLMAFEIVLARRPCREQV